MYFTVKCLKCQKHTLEPSFEETAEKYQEAYLSNIKTMLPYETAPLEFNYLIFRCCDPLCNCTEEMTLQLALSRLSEEWSSLAWASVRKQVGTPDNFEEYFRKYIYDKGLHKEVSQSDREQNPFIDRLLKNAEKKYPKNSSS